MYRSSVRGVRLAAAMLTTLAVAAAPAQARITPVGGRILASAGNSGIRGAGDFRCPTSEVIGATINGTGTAISSSVNFTTGVVVTCTAFAAGFSVRIDCVGRITFRVALSSVASRSAIGPLVLDNGFNCKFTTANGCVYDMRGPQSPGGIITFTDSDQNLNFNVTGLSVDRSAGGILCPAGTTRAAWTGDYRITSGGPVLVS